MFWLNVTGYPVPVLLSLLLTPSICSDWHSTMLWPSLQSDIEIHAQLLIASTGYQHQIGRLAQKPRLRSRARLLFLIRPTQQ